MSTRKYRPSHPLPPDYLPELRRQVWGRMFGFYIREGRAGIHMTVEEAAGRSGMTVPEWAAIEAGHVPQHTDQVRAMAAALGVPWDKMFNMLVLCREAWIL